jgi:hypothetical protein
MKFIFFPLLLVSLFFFSCQEVLDVPEEPPEEVISPPDFISIRGERFEKYYAEIHPSLLNTPITLSSPNILGFQYGSSPVYYAFNQITLHDVPLARFTETSPFSAQVSGTAAVSGKSGANYAAYSYPFETQTLLYPDPAGYPLEPYDVLNTFTNKPGCLVLPYTGDYSSALVIQEFRKFSMAIPSDLLLSLVTEDSFQIPFPSVLTAFTIDGVYSADMVCSCDHYLLLAPKSRNFYQYKSLTAVFSPDAVVSDIRQASIVESHVYNPDNNSVTVVFNDYDASYTGEVLFYKIRSGDAGEEEAVEKIIRIEGIEN